MRRTLVIAAAVVLAAVSSSAVAPPASAATVRPFGSVVEAESYDAQHGVRVFADPAASGGHAVAFSDGDRLRLDAVDFGVPGQASGFATWRSCATGAGTVELRLDSPTATPFLTFQPAGGTCAQWFQSSTRMGVATTPTGVHDLYLSFTSASRCEFYRLDSFQLIKQTGPPIP
ncbi:carbohydrate-binding protein [Dactylosporangium sp. NPDC000244]|uniref:carbohydrate-binding protein n=1 Tax=Dactylosporangium sp. NPDC000244 TaxID=3154365 RepID=UPI003319DE03